MNNLEMTSELKELRLSFRGLSDEEEEKEPGLDFGDDDFEEGLGEDEEDVAAEGGDVSEREF